MSVNIFDVALQLRAGPGTALVATASETGVALPMRFLPTCDWVIQVATMAATGTYVFTLEVSNVVGGTYTAIASHTWLAAQGPGVHHIAINGDMASSADADCAFARVTATIGGATPSVQYGSFLSKAGNKYGVGVKQGDLVAFP